MIRRSFIIKTNAVLAATWLGLVGQADADVVDLTKKSKAKREEEECITVKIMGFHGEKLGESKYFRKFMSWTCKYQVTRADGSIVVRESPQVLSNGKNDPPTRYQLDLS